LSAKRGVLGGADARDAQRATVRRFLATDEAKYITDTELVVDGTLTINCF
jgi:hypothetical protein